MKYQKLSMDVIDIYRRSRKGAWIEILMNMTKLLNRRSRSRKGAWIEIGNGTVIFSSNGRRSRKGAWIEIPR